MQLLLSVAQSLQNKTFWERLQTHNPAESPGRPSALEINHQHQAFSSAKRPAKRVSKALGPEATHVLWPRARRRPPPPSTAVLLLGRVEMPFLTEGPGDQPSRPGSVGVLEPQVTRLGKRGSPGWKGEVSWCRTLCSLGPAPAAPVSV